MKKEAKTCATLSIASICLLLMLYPVASSHAEDNEFTITMPGITFKEEEAYLCYFWKPPFTNKRYITSFDVIPDSSYVHHILIYTCAGSLNESVFKKECPVCEEQSIIFAWARNAPKLVLPKNVGFEISTSKASYIRMEVHYRKTVKHPDHTILKMAMTETTQVYLAGVGLYASANINFPPNTKQILASLSCRYDNDDDIVPFGFRTHTHSHGKVLTGYVYRKGKWLLIGKGNPQWPQTFWPVQTEDLHFQKGDVIAVRAVFSTENETQSLQIGKNHNDEMNNYYIMYYKKASANLRPVFCIYNNFPEIVEKLPADANTLLPPNKTLDSMAMAMSHHHPPTPDPKYSNTSEAIIEKFHTMSISPLNSWPKLPEAFEFGQVTGLSKDSQGYLYVFHRASFIWDDNVYYVNGSYSLDKNKPIKENTLVKINAETGEIVKMTGAKFFYNPHGIFIDSHNFIWLTDAALQQVFKFSPDIFDGGKMQPLLTLGTRFEPGSDQTHFCKPSDVVVSNKGDIFVSDGYCNKRIVMFDSAGKFIREMLVGNHSTFKPPLPHSISLDEKNNLIYLAARLELCVYVYKTDGAFVKKIHSTAFKHELFAVHYNADADKLFCVDGNLVDFKKPYFAHVVILDPHQEIVISSWDLPESSSLFDTPHDIEVSDDAKAVYVAILGRKGKILKFEASVHNKQLGLEAPTYDRNLLHAGPRKDDTERKLPSLASALLVVLALMIIPLVIVIGVFVYIKSRHKRHVFNYSKLRNQEGRNGVAARKSELKGLSVGSDDDDEEEDEEDDVFDASIFKKKRKS